MQDQQLAHSTQQQQLQEQQQPQPQHPTGASSASNRPLWLGRSTPAGPSPVSTAQQAYQRLVDEFTLTALLAQIAGNNAAAYRAASLINLATGLPERETGFRDHWVQVARSLNLTQEQTVSLQVSYQQFNRYRAVLKGRQVDACKQVDHEICRQLERLGLNKQQQQEQQEGPGRSLPATAGGALGVGPAACRHHAVPVEGAPPSKNSISQLEGVMSGFMVSTQMLLVHLLNTLTYPQKARLMVSSYPYLPQPGSILEGINNMVLEDHHQQRQQQPQQQMQQSTEQRRSAPTQNSAPATKHDSAAGASTEIQLQQQPGSLLLSMHEAELQLRRADLQQQQVGFWERNQHLLVLAQQQLESENSRAASQQQKCSSGQSVKV